jgi:hypothetical protein
MIDRFDGYILMPCSDMKMNCYSAIQSLIHYCACLTLLTPSRICIVMIKQRVPIPVQHIRRMDQHYVSKEAKREIDHLWDAILSISENINADIVPVPTNWMYRIIQPLQSINDHCLFATRGRIVRLSVFNIRGRGYVNLLTAVCQEDFIKLFGMGRTIAIVR